MKKLNTLRSLCSGLLLSALLLSGCASRQGYQPEDTAAAESVVRRFVDGVLAEDAESLSGLVSSPFWADEWIPDAQSVIEEFVSDASEDIPDSVDITFRLYPLGDLAALRPDFWADLQAASTPEQLKDLYLGAVALNFPDKPDAEGGLMLLRKVDGRWTLAGLIEE